MYYSSSQFFFFKKKPNQIEITVLCFRCKPTSKLLKLGSKEQLNTIK